MKLELGFQVLEKIDVHSIVLKSLHLRKDLKIESDIFVSQKTAPGCDCLGEEGAKTLALLSPLLVAGKMDRCVGNLGTLFVLKSVCKPKTEVPVLRISEVGTQRLKELAAGSFFLPQFANGYNDPKYFLYFLSGLVGEDLVKLWTNDLFRNKSHYAHNLRLNRSTLDDKLTKFQKTFGEVLSRD